MARTLLAVQDSAQAGLEATYTAAIADGHAFANDYGDVILHVVNGGGGDSVVTITTPNTVGGLAVSDQTVTVTAGEERIIGPFKRSLFNQTSTTPALANAVYIDTDVQTSVTYAAIRVAKAG